MKQYFNNLVKEYSISIIKYAVLFAAALLIIDIYDLPSKYIILNKSVLIGFIAFTIIIILNVLELKLVQAFKIIMINYVDLVSVLIIATSLIYIIFAHLLVKISLYKIITTIILLIVSSIIITIRVQLFDKQIKNSKKYETTVIDLLDAYKGNIKNEKGHVVLVKEEDVNYDLLERDSIINKLYNAIIDCNPERKFVISLEGKWGSGKTTILNNVKLKISKTNSGIVIIDEFDPWTYSDQESLLYNMFDIILSKTEFEYSTLYMKNMIYDICETVLGSKKALNAVLKLFFKKHSNKINDIKAKINNFLNLYGKKVVFFIDNIDRAENENIILLFKLIGNVFNFNRVTYVLSFDNERVEKIFSDDLNIDSKYLKKIIQMQIKVPEINKPIMKSLFKRCINNLIIAYGEAEENLHIYCKIIAVISEHITDMRDFKRFINSVVSPIFCQHTYLNKRDLLVIEYIHFSNYELYKSIYQNKKYYISFDNIYDEQIYINTFNREKFELKAKEYFDKLFSHHENKVFSDLLAEIFPYVKRYKENQTLKYIINDDYGGVTKNKGVCSAKFFDLYFTYTSNDFLEINVYTSKFITDVNKSLSKDDREHAFIKLLTGFNSFCHKEILELIQLYIEDLNAEAINDLIYILFDNIGKIDNSGAFLALNARQRAELIICELLQKITDFQFDNFINTVSREFGKISNISGILYWFKNESEDKNVIGRKEKWQDMYKNMGKEILNEAINLYDDKYYSDKNIWGLVKLYKEKSEAVKGYVNKIFNEENLFRLIYDTIGVSYSGAKCIYNVKKEYLESLTTEKKINEMLEKVAPRTDDEKFVLSIYQEYKKGYKNYGFIEGGIITEHEKKLTL